MDSQKHQASHSTENVAPTGTMVSLADRRRFLLGIAGGAVVSASPPLLASAAHDPVPDAPARSGYRATEHVRKYYMTARL